MSAPIQADPMPARLTGGRPSDRFHWIWLLWAKCNRPALMNDFGSLVVIDATRANYSIAD